jgi:hypothetical protein
MLKNILREKKLKLLLKRRETQIKNLMVNDSKYIEKLISDPIAALLQAGIDLNNSPVKVTASPLIASSPNARVNPMITHTVWVASGVSFNIFAGEKSYSAGLDIENYNNDIVPDIDDYKQLSHVKKFIVDYEKSAMTINFLHYSLVDMKLQNPENTEILINEIKAKRDEESGKTLLSSDELYNSILNYFKITKLSEGEIRNIEGCSIQLILESTEVTFVDSQDLMDEKLIFPLKYFSDVFDENSECNKQLNNKPQTTLNGKGSKYISEYNKRLFKEFRTNEGYIQRTYVFNNVNEDGYIFYLRTNTCGIFSINQEGNGLILQDKDKIDSCEWYDGLALSVYLMTNLSSDTKESLKKFIKLYQ